MYQDCMGAEPGVTHAVLNSVLEHSLHFVLETKFSVELQILFRFFWASVRYLHTTRLGSWLKERAALLVEDAFEGMDE